MNKHTALVKKWLAGLESVSKENANEVNKMWVDEQLPFELLQRVAAHADARAAAAAYWVKRYEKLTSE